MTYYFSRTFEDGFDAVVGRTREALKQEGFGVITEIDVQATLKTKIDVDFRPYLILGACNPAMAHEALQIEDKVGMMLPCNLVGAGTSGRTHRGRRDRSGRRHGGDRQSCAVGQGGGGRGEAESGDRAHLTRAGS